jgi:hypothetical protein
MIPRPYPRDDSGNTHFSFHLIVRKMQKAACAIKEDCKKLIHISRLKKKYTELIFQSCLPHHMTASSFMNKNNVAGLQFLLKFSRDSCMSWSVQHVSRVQHSMVGDTYIW